MMYFDEINIFDKEPEYNNVGVYCYECGDSDILEIDQFEKLVDKEYVILKEGTMLKCEKCGKEHEDRKILYRRKDHYATVNIPKCPVCQSTNLKKISAGSKLLAAGTVGVFALPYTSKTFECKSCGYKF